MKEETAWFKQARSDLRAYRALASTGADVCQQILHLQMSAEKLLKGFSPSLRSKKTHAAVQSYFADFKILCVSDPSLRKAVSGPKGRRSDAARVLAGLERTLLDIESLNPSVAAKRVASKVAVDQKNCEYPWESVGGAWQAPVAAKFGRTVGKLPRIKVARLLDHLLTSQGH